MTLSLLSTINLFSQQQLDSNYEISLKSRTYIPIAGVSQDSLNVIQANLNRILADTLLAKVGKTHILVQLERLPDRMEKEDFKRHGIQFLNYIPENTWLVAVSQDVKYATLQLESLGLRWVGRMIPDDKASDAIKENRLTMISDSLVVLLVQFHRTVSLDIGKQIVERHGGNINREVKTINSLIITIPVNRINPLMEEDFLLWIEQAPPPLEGTNDGIRFMTNVDLVQANPFNLDGDGVNVLVFDAGLVDDNHPDFGTRVTNGEASVNWGVTTITVEDHPTHVAGTLGGDGNESAGDGGVQNQWRGMAPAVNIISYGVDWDGTDIFLYNNLTDLEDNFKEGIQDHDIDLATASVGTNVAANGYNCAMEGDYEAT